MRWIWTIKWHVILQAINWVEHNREKPVSTFLCILQNEVPRSPRKKERGVVDLFPFLSAANSLLSESLAFSTVCFSRELKFSSTFRKHELHTQGTFLALCGRPRSMWVHTRMCGPCTLVLGSHFCSMSLSLCPVTPPLGWTLLFYPFPTDEVWNCIFPLNSLRPVLWQALSGSQGRRGHLATGVIVGHEDERLFFLEKDHTGESHKANRLAGPSLCPTGLWHKGMNFGWTYPWVKHILNSF